MGTFDHDRRYDRRDDPVAAVFADDGRFPHPCTHPGCGRTVEFDDEPWCFTHSPDAGSAVTGWSARRGDPPPAGR